MFDGHWISPLRRDDLTAVFPSLFSESTRVTKGVQTTEIEVGQVEEDRTVKDDIQDAMFEKLVGMAVERTVGVKVDVADLWADGVEGVRIQLSDGPNSATLVKPPSSSGWGALSGLTSLARRVLGEENREDEGSMGLFDLLAKVGRKHEELAAHEPDRVVSLCTDLVKAEVITLLARILHGWGPTPKEIAAIPSSELRSQAAAKIDPRQVVQLFR